MTIEDPPSQAEFEWEQIRTLLTEIRAQLDRIEGFHMDKIKDIPANPNSIEIGLSDPTPEKGKGGTWRAIVSWVKGFGK